MSTGLIHHLRVVTLAAACCWASAASANLVTNGDFSTSHVFPGHEGIPWNQEPDAWTTSGLTEEGRVTGGWYFSSGTLVVPNSFYGNYAGGTSNVLAIFNRGALFQDFEVLIAGEYIVSWHEATLLDGFDPPPMGDRYESVRPDRYEVHMDGGMLSSRLPEENQDYTLQSFSVMLTAGTHRLSFAGQYFHDYILYGSANQYAQSTTGYMTLIDNVSVTAVPEPETYALMLAGLVAVAMVKRRHRGRPVGPAALG